MRLLLEILQPIEDPRKTGWEVDHSQTDGVINAFTESGIKNPGSSKQNGQVVNQDSASTAKIGLFRSLFRVRTDVYPQEDTNAFLETCRQRDLPAALERS